MATSCRRGRPTASIWRRARVSQQVPLPRARTLALTRQALDTRTTAGRWSTAPPRFARPAPTTCAMTWCLRRRSRCWMTTSTHTSSLTCWATAMARHVPPPTRPPARPTSPPSTSSSAQWTCLQLAQSACACTCMAPTVRAWAPFPSRRRSMRQPITPSATSRLLPASFATIPARLRTSTACSTLRPP